MDYDSGLKGVVCTVCKNYGIQKVPSSAWVTRPVDNWMKFTTLLKKHEKSGWHLVAVERRAVNQSSQDHCDVVDIIVTVSEEEKKHNYELIKKHMRYLYLLVKHCIFHTITFESLITLQIKNGEIKMKFHPKNARVMQPESYATVVELLTSISKTLESNLSVVSKSTPTIC